MMLSSLLGKANTWPKWALAVIVLASATTTYGNSVHHTGRRKGAHLLVNGWSLPPRPRQFHHATINSIGGTRPQRHYSTTVLNVRGGSDEPLNDDESDGENSNNADSGSTDDGMDAMQELRSKWSSIPATPSISLPVTDVPGDDRDPFQTLGTLADIDDDAQASTNTKPTKAIIIMDGFSPYHGQYLSHAARNVYGAAVIHVLSDFFTRFLYQVQDQSDHLSSRMPDLTDAEEIEAWVSLLRSKSLEICGIYCESDSGLDDAERLGVALGLYPRCHDGVNAARRDKFLMIQMVAEVGGLDVVQQKSCETLEEAEEFAKSLGLGEDEEGAGGDASSPLVVVKPPRGVASDDVHLCNNLPSLRKAFAKIISSPVFGSATAAKHKNVLVQEFATGVEYAVDVVCRDGVRKAAAVWRYDKRAVNGAPFVYHATELVPADEDGSVEKEVCDYIFKAMDALGMRWGLSHVEVIAETSPETGKIRVRLVEVNCRQHNTDFMPLCNACVGYNALDLVLAAHLGDNSEDDDMSSPHSQHRLEWDSVPTLPTTRAHGAIVHFVSHVEGTISNIRFDVFEEMEELPSVMDMHVYPQFMDVGSPIEKTVDIRSDTGWVHLMNDDEEEFQRDYARLVELQKLMFDVE